MLFGASNLKVTESGLECDNWLPIVGNVSALDDVERLKEVLDLSLLRVFEGLESLLASLTSHESFNLVDRFTTTKRIEKATTKPLIWRILLSRLAKLQISID